MRLWMSSAGAQSSTSRRVHLSGHERLLGADEIIVSKTDPAGRITYANRVFQRISGYSERELLGAPHNLVRHPDMPRAVFQLLWETIAAGEELFAYVVNRARNGDHYWVLAHVTPTFDARGAIVGYHSNRRAPARAALEVVAPLYRELCAEEARHDDRKQGMAAARRTLAAALAAKGLDVQRLAFVLQGLP
jgi:PAS domain S-box-containing protein